MLKNRFGILGIAFFYEEARKVRAANNPTFAVFVSAF